MRVILSVVLLLTSLICTPAQAQEPAGPTWAGVRSSPYGPGGGFPQPGTWSGYMNKMKGYFPGATGIGLWNVGALNGRGMKVEFPKPDNQSYPNITFQSSDKHEKYLKHFDDTGMKVWLSLEPGFASVDQLVDLALNRYKRHPSVQGIQVDVEWYQGVCEDCGQPVPDDVAQRWEQKIKGHDQRLSLMLKHYDPKWMPPTYRGDIRFTNDSQFFETLEGFVAEFKIWADTFYPSPVLYQYGYQSDKKWWGKLAKPYAKTIGDAMAQVTRQTTWGTVWVDFSLKDL
ncbi:hypothetical protein FKR81_18205 [Lentzea tibetensis]|uniref:Glycoside hydrolase family 42 N-terminal domain-containing protein n=1 Tax=Lentzea tibetensis TaxID=2591470 RepID=A0A563ETU3_9PSEU|nr:hypothetical protein [Lentzea tibetensis]TWP51002.1 hypothetical protein FKR81_18205 [Lentzea tibetensis]